MQRAAKALGVFLLMTVMVMAGWASGVKSSPGGNSGNNNNIIRIDPYNCGEDPCLGYRCVGGVALDTGTSVSPACYNAAELDPRNCRKGAYAYIPDFNVTCHNGDYYYVWTRK